MDRDRRTLVPRRPGPPAARREESDVPAHLTCFADDMPRDRLDHAAFTVPHRLLGHPALSLENLERAIPALPPSQVFFSSGRLDRRDDFDRAHLDHRNGLSIEATLETIRHGTSYVMVRAPETHPSFQPLYRELCDDVRRLMRARGVGDMPHGAMLYLFIASPGSVTPFHIDRYSTLLMQFRGTKEVTVFPPWDERVVPAVDREGFVANSGQRAVWRPEIEPLGRCFRFAPGDALHIPFVAGHHVRNGPDDVSISLSIIFNTDETRAQSRAMVFNHVLRRRLGLHPRPVGGGDWRDAVKAGVWGTGARLAHALGHAGH